MDEQSFIALQLSDLTVKRADFEPFVITLVQGEDLSVFRKEAVTMLSGGFIYHEQDGSYRVAPYDKILCLRTNFET
ncbi:MAG TPA: hypothetical protein VGB55_08150 [Tepidisphaeraceae bacterium]|jgi:hypothetical protein